MIEGAEVIAIARKYFDTVYNGASLQEVLLEEAEVSEDGDFWFVTFGFDWQPASGTSSIGPGDRRFKTLKLDAKSGAVLSMKNAKINT